jgi:hypothetical protein
VEARGGRLIWPIFQGGPPCQLFNAFNLLESEVANRILIVGFEINVDLLGCGSKPMSLHIDGAHLPKFQRVRTNILQVTQCSLALYKFPQGANPPIALYSNWKDDRFAFDKTIKLARD